MLPDRHRHVLTPNLRYSLLWTMLGATGHLIDDESLASPDSGDKERSNVNVSIWGGDGPMTYSVLESLLRSGVHVGSLVTPVAAPETDVDAPPERRYPDAPAPDDEFGLRLATPFVSLTACHLAWRHDIPVYTVKRLADPATAAFVRDLGADIACAACFPCIIPATMLDVPRNGFLNVHPSRLPAYRGPAPFFRQLRNGLTTVGVTVHWMDAGIDTGDIAAQTDVNLPIGITGPEADRLFGATGAALLCDVLSSLAQGSVPRQTTGR